MTRLNIDFKSVNGDQRFIALGKALGSSGDAWEMLLGFWDLAQDKWKIGELVHEKMFVACGFAPLLEVDLAEKRAEGIYARGSEQRFAWIRQRMDAGKRPKRERKPARAKRNANETKRPLNETQAEHKREPNEIQAGGKREASLLTPNSFLVTPSSICDGHPETGGQSPPSTPLEPKPRKPREPKPPAASSAVWEAYHASYVARYGAEPIRNAKANGQCAQLVGRLGLERAVAVAGWYVGHSDFLYVKAMHPLGLALRDAEALWTQYETGRRVTTKDARGAEADDINRGVFERLAAKMEAREKNEAIS